MATTSSNGVISGAIKWTGLASGTDFASVVEKLVAIEQRTITRQEAWKTEWQEKIKAISDLNTRLVSLKMDAQSKDTKSELLSRKSTISNPDIMSVINTSTANLGSYDVTVGTNIAEKLASRSYTVAQNVFGSTSDGTISIQIGSDPLNIITISSAAVADHANGVIINDGTATLEDIKDAIIGAAGKLVPPMNIKAEVLNDKLDPAGPPGSYSKRLVLTALDGGSANRITVTTTGTGIAGLDDLNKQYIDEPVKTTFLGSKADISTAGSTYLGNVNKTFTFVATNRGILGAEDVELQWADTEGHSGKFTITAADFNAQTVANPKEYEIMQGLHVSFPPTGATGEYMFMKSESFTIDCQAPVLQRGQDSGLAQTAKVVHSGFADQISPIHTGTAAKFRYKYQGVEYSVNVTDKMSLGVLANMINEASDNPGITASIVNDGQGTSTSYHLVLTGNHTGAESTIEVIDNDSDPLEKIAYFSTAGFTTSREASNAMIKVDGFPSGDDNWIQRRSNEISDIIDGVVVTVTGTGTSTLTVSNDHEAMRDKILQLVQSVNFCKTFIIENTKWGGSNLQVGMTDSGEVTTSRETANGLMIGNYGFQISQSKLDAFMNTSLVPFSLDPSLSTKQKMEKREKYYEDNGLIYTNLSDIGITSDPDNQGLYKVEQSKLLSCIQSNPEAVIKLFTFTDSYVEHYGGEDHEIVIRGAAVALFEDMTELTSTTDITDTNGNVTKKGKGIMVTLQENYEGIIAGIDAKIAREERRIQAVRQRYTDRFNRLETALQQLQDKQSQLQSSLSSLGSNSSS